jgi:hypothetical protein
LEWQVMMEISRGAFVESAICHYGDNSIPVEDIYTAIHTCPLQYSGTSVALYQMNTETKPALLKIFSPNWSPHTKDFCDWAYGRKLHSRELSHLFLSLGAYIQRLCDYGLEVDVPLAAWDIMDPFQDGTDERALAIVVKEYSEPSIRKRLFDLRDKGEQREIIRTFEDHVTLLLQVIAVAKELGDVSDYVIRYGVDLKPRNLILAKDWIYVDLFPILTPFELERYRKMAPMKAFMKRFDTRYYIFDLLFRYYKIVPDLISIFIDIAQGKTVHFLAGEAKEYTNFALQHMNAYITKWGHMPPDKDWQHPFVH